MATLSINPMHVSNFIHQEKEVKDYLEESEKKIDFYLFGLNQLTNLDRCMAFFMELKQCIHFDFPNCTLIINDSVLDVLNEFDPEFIDLTEFYNLVNCVSFINLPSDLSIYKKVVNVEELIFTLAEVHELKYYELKAIVNCWPNLKGLKIYQEEQHISLDHILQLAFLNGIEKFACLQKFKFVF